MAVRCTACGRESEWPHPELGCGSCGTVVHLPVHPLERPEDGTGRGAGPAAATGPARPADPAGPAGHGGRGGQTGPADLGGGGTAEPRGGGTAAGPDADPSHLPAPPAAVPRPAFRPVTIRTARDAVATAALYLRWLGFQDVRQPDGRPIPSAAVDLRAPGLVAQVDPTTAPAGLRAVECVWLNGLTASATSVYFSLAGYTEEARSRADALGIPLFVMDLTGMPQPVNDPADALVGSGAWPQTP
ncbi:PHD finger domain-containing protein [Streptomyces yangpuensis]|uniref:PHD finger domain-containing protein n=1 Tax=Streptomyces yangpuensis TaxID=1648182 RepID=UPI0036B75C10